MDWKKYWNQVSSEKKDFVAQVQRNHEKESEITAEHISQILNIQSSDSVLDVCCGNGMLTQEISKKCNKIIGIDQSENLITVAKNHFLNNCCSFLVGEAQEIPLLVKTQFDKIYLEFSFQYFDQKNEGKKVIQSLLEVLKPQGQLFLGDIPEKGKEKKLYNTPKKKAYYRLAKIKGSNTMGKFWSSEKIDTICQQLNVKGQKITQPEHLPYSHYRFDYLIQK